MKPQAQLPARIILDDGYIQIRLHRPLPSPQAEWTAIENLINLLLRRGIPPLEIADQLIGVRATDGTSIHTIQPHHIGEWMISLNHNTKICHKISS